MSTAVRLRDRLGAFFALDDPWQRPAPPVGRADVLTGLVVAIASVVTFELARSAGGVPATVPLGWQYADVALAGLALTWRRSRPIAVALFLAAHMFLNGITMPMVMAQLALQICYFAGLYNAMAWGRNRRTALLASGAIVGFMLLWVAWQFALGSGLQELVDSQDSSDSTGFFPAIPSAVLLTFVLNVLYFVGAVLIGQLAWRSARDRAGLAEQAATISAQADQLRRRAVVGERLRIARELHDVVGHHVSVIGVQAAGARRVLRVEPDTASAALQVVEDSSRQAVAQMRSLLGTLRDLEDEDAGRARGPEPGVLDLPALAEERTLGGVRTDYRLVEDERGGTARIPGPLGLSLYRTAQEALANVARHSTAGSASLTLRVVERGRPAYVEIEVIDDGRPRSGTSGSGLGQLGIRERASSHRGECDIGPRATGGYRVRVRLPLTGASDE